MSADFKAAGAMAILFSSLRNPRNLWIALLPLHGD
jgi:hypothetical protein